MGNLIYAIGNLLQKLKSIIKKKRFKGVVPVNDDKEDKTIYSSSSNKLPPISTWEHAPLFLQADPSVVTLSGQNKWIGQHNSSLSCPIGIPFQFESDLFKGQAFVRVRDLESSADPTSDQKYFQGRKRKNQIIIQGKFKEEIKCTDAISGTEYKESFSLQPPMFIQSLLHKLLRRISPSLEISLCGNKPKVLVCLGEAAQVISVDNDGEQLPDIRSINLQEKGFADSPQTRKKLFTSLHNTDNDNDSKSSESMTYDTDKVYTFELYDDIMDYVSYNMHVAPFLKFDMVKTLGKQPFQVMARTKTDRRYLWLFTMYHSGHSTN